MRVSNAHIALQPCLNNSQAIGIKIRLMIPITGMIEVIKNLAEIHPKMMKKAIVNNNAIAVELSFCVFINNSIN